MLVDTFERLTPSNSLISPASSDSGEENNSACTCAIVRLIPQAWPISPQWSTNFCAAGVSFTVASAASGLTVSTERILTEGRSGKSVRFNSVGGGEMRLHQSALPGLARAVRVD